MGLSQGVLANLRVTEVMYHPVEPNAEYVELTNIGTQPVNLNLAGFTKGIDFTFPAMTRTLTPLSSTTAGMSASFTSR